VTICHRLTYLLEVGEERMDVYLIGETVGNLGRFFVRSRGGAKESNLRLSASPRPPRGTVPLGRSGEAQSFAVRGRKLQSVTFCNRLTSLLAKAVLENFQ
jgi:hypothetical protein